MGKIYSAQRAWGECTAVSVTEISMVPERPPQAMLTSLLSACEEAGTSLELLCMPDERQQGRTRVLLILRCTGLNPRTQSERTAALTRLVLEKLSLWGFEAVQLDEDACYELSRGLARRPNAALCFAGENLRNVKRYYAPGGFDALQRLDPQELFGALRNRESAGFSVQMSAAKLMKSERDIVDRNIRWLTDRQAGKEEADQAAKAFQQVRRLDGQALFFTCVTIWGDAQAMAALSLIARQRGFVLAQLPGDLLGASGGDYLGDGAILLADWAARNAHVLGKGIVVPKDCQRLNHLVPPGMLNELLIPREPAPTPVGLKVNRVPRDDAPLPAELSGDEGIRLGTRASNGQPVCLPLNRWSKHAAVVGMPGTGKTTFAFLLLHELHRNGVPFLAVEPTKTEYRALLDDIPELKVYTPGRSEVTPMQFNPFLPPEGVTLEMFLPALEAAFQTAFSMPSPMDVIFANVLRTCYTRYGWRLNSTRDSEGARRFGMRDFIAVFREEAQQSGYSQESRANLESGGVYRFQSLLDANGVLFDTDRPLPTDQLLKRPTLIELDAIANPEQKSLLLSLLLIHLNLVIRRDQKPDGALKNAILIDEAHVLLGQRQYAHEAGDADPSGRLVASLQQMVLENRAYGTGMIFADQSPHKLTAEIMGNVDIQLIFRLNSASDRRMLAENLNLPANLTQAIDALPVGQCYLQTQGLEEPVRLVTPDSRQLLKLGATMDGDEVRRRCGEPLLPPFRDCPCQGECSLEARREAEFIAESIADRHRRELCGEREDKALVDGAMMDELNEAVRGKEDRARLYHCAEFHLRRRIADARSKAAGQAAGQ